MKVKVSGLNFPEGPIILGGGKLAIGECSGGAVVIIDEAGSIERRIPVGGSANGLALGPDNAIYVCNNGGGTYRTTDDGLLLPIVLPPEDYQGGSIQRISLDTYDVTTVYTHCGTHRLSAPNQLVFDSNGGFYFTDSGKIHLRTVDRGGVYYATVDGTRIDQVIYPLDCPNGIALSPDGSQLYVVETITSRVWKWRITEPGTVAAPSSAFRPGDLLCTLDDYQLLDSLAIEANGNICVATLGKGVISVISPDGHLLEQVPVPGPDPFVTNICFGEPHNEVAYITSSARGLLYETPWPRTGLRLAFSPGLAQLVRTRIAVEGTRPGLHARSQGW
jgi:gluconolactonase